jgi:hypothetical protein
LVVGATGEKVAFSLGKAHLKGEIATKNVLKLAAGRPITPLVEPFFAIGVDVDVLGFKQVLEG